MATHTWKTMFGSEYGPSMPQPVDFNTRNYVAFSPIVNAFMSLLGKAKDLGAPAPTGPAQAYGNGAVTPHTAGATIDIRYRAVPWYDKKSVDHQRAFANGLIELLIKHRSEIGWGVVEYNKLEFKPHGVDVKNDASHDDHVHIDWIDYGASRSSSVLATYEYYEQTIPKTLPKVQKTMRATGSWISMSTNAAASNTQLPDAFVNDFNNLCRDSTANFSKHEKYTIDDFKAAYIPVKPTVPVPQWLIGWWEVSWRSQTYYYYFANNHQATWTQIAPLNYEVPPICFPIQNGIVGVDIQGKVTITWNDTGSIETLTLSVGSTSLQMNGFWQNLEHLWAIKLPRT
jgi:hypothetical protein